MGDGDGINGGAGFVGGIAGTEGVDVTVVTGRCLEGVGKVSIEAGRSLEGAEGTLEGTEKTSAGAATMGGSGMSSGGEVVVVVVVVVVAFVVGG